MKRRLWGGVLLSILLVPVSSLLGLWPAMTTAGVDTGNGWTTFREVWAANFWGDLVFTLGTIAAACGTVWFGKIFWDVGRKKSSWLISAPLSFFSQWVVYWLSASLTLNAGFFGPVHFLQFSFQPGGDTFLFVLSWGIPGLAFAAMAAPIAGLLLFGTSSKGADDAAAPPQNANG